MDKNLVIIIVAFVFLLIVVFMYMSAKAKTEQSKLAVMQTALQVKAQELDNKTTFRDVIGLFGTLGSMTADIGGLIATGGASAATPK